jgi:hypothetical protein
MANRREFLKLLSLGVIGHTLDIDRLLWIPGEKTIFIPSQKQIDFISYVPEAKGYLNLSKIIAMELDIIRPKIGELFDRDSYFYSRIITENDIQGKIS